VLEVILVEVEPERCGLVGEPPERDVGQPIENVAAADVRVAAGEPSLNQGLIFGGAAPNFGHEVVAAFVDGQRLTGVANAARRLIAEVEPPVPAGGPATRVQP